MAAVYLASRTLQHLRSYRVKTWSVSMQVVVDPPDAEASPMVQHLAWSIQIGPSPALLGVFTHL